MQAERLEELKKSLVTNYQSHQQDPERLWNERIIRDSKTIQRTIPNKKAIPLPKEIVDQAPLVTPTQTTLTPPHSPQEARHG